MIFHWRALRTTILATGSALALLAAPLGDHACAEGKLDASYTVSFGRIRVGEITAIFVLGDKEYAISAHGRAGGVMKALVDGEGSFSTRGTLTDGHPVPTKFTSKIVSNTETSDVTMVLDEGSVKDLEAAPPPSSSRVPVTEANRHGIVDPLTAMLFSAAAEGDGLSQQACRRTLFGTASFDLNVAGILEGFRPGDQDGTAVSQSIHTTPCAADGVLGATSCLRYLKGPDLISGRDRWKLRRISSGLAH